MLQVGVKAFLRNAQQQYLLLKRNPEKYPETTNRWDIVGGRIDPGSDLLQNLKREIFEETGLLLESQPELIKAQDILKQSNRHVVRLTYVADIEGEPVLSDEHIDSAWLTVQEMLKLDGLDSYAREILEHGLLDTYYFLNRKNI